MHRQGFSQSPFLILARPTAGQFKFLQSEKRSSTKQKSGSLDLCHSKSPETTPTETPRGNCFRGGCSQPQQVPAPSLETALPSTPCSPRPRPARLWGVARAEGAWPASGRGGASAEAEVARRPELGTAQALGATCQRCSEAEAAPRGSGGERRRSASRSARGGEEKRVAGCGVRRGAGRGGRGARPPGSRGSSGAPGARGGGGGRGPRAGARRAGAPQRGLALGRAGRARGRPPRPRAGGEGQPPRSAGAPAPGGLGSAEKVRSHGRAALFCLRAPRLRRSVCFPSLQYLQLCNLPGKTSVRPEVKPI